MVNKQPKALRLADGLDTPDEDGFVTQLDQDAAAELRRLHAENEDFRATCDHLTRENAEQIGEIVALKEQRDENEKLREENAKLQKWIVGEAQVAGTLDRKLRKARKQRDELLEACKALTQIKNIDVAATGPLKAAVEKSAAAITKAESES